METVTAKHYEKEGKQYARVTSIVKMAYPDAFDHIPESKREYYFERGTQNHKLWEMVEMGKDKDYDFDPAVEKYRKGHARFLAETGFKALPGGIEKRVYNDDLGYAGTVDRIGTVGTRVFLIDLKTNEPIQLIPL